MLIYCESKGKFCSDAASGRIADTISGLFSEHGLEHESKSEYNSWKNSLSYMCRILNDKRFSDELQIAVEYQLPQTSKRADLIIAGDDENGRHNVIIVELKQWSQASVLQRDYVVKAITGGTEQAVAHPSYQAYSYAKILEEFDEAVSEEKIGLHPCAYLHNYERGQKKGIEDPAYEKMIEKAPLFLKGEEELFRDFIKKYVSRPSKINIMHQLDSGRIRPSKALQDAVSGMMSGSEEFCLLDEQKVVFEAVRKLAEKALKSNKKYTVIVEGGPGTGKSVIAVQLLASLIESGYNARYVTKNAAPRSVYRNKLTAGECCSGSLFKGSGEFTFSKADEVDCIVVDEAHRLTEKSGFRSNEINQIREIIKAAKVSVFFIDEAQTVTAKDIGTVAEIKRWAGCLGSAVLHNDSTKLHSQFRCNGSDGYISFLEYILGMSHEPFSCSDLGFEFRLYEDPVRMRSDLFEKNRKNNRSRITAGYCWDWKTRGVSDRDREKYDIILPGGFKAKWNFNDKNRIWAIDEDSFDQVGCIHTSQGLEFEYIGVIIGRDLRYEDNMVITDRSVHPKMDKSFIDGSGRECSAEKADFIIRNTYKTLMTRGQKGCYVYCEDKRLYDHFRSVISRTEKP